ALGIPAARLAPLFRDIREGAIERLLKANGLLAKAAYVKVVVTRGEDIRRGLAPGASMEPTVIMTAGPLDEKAIRLMRTKGVRAVLVKGLHPAMPGIKTLNYLPSVLARMEARKAGVEEAVFTAPDGALLEAAGANLFIVERGVIKTPPLNANPFLPGVLPGVTRKAVIDIAGKLGIRVMAARLPEDGLRRCGEAFLTNSTCGVVPLVSVDSVKVADGRPGPVTRGLQRHL
ncbi:MAG: aminotransferase class IV, partial [Deltaproteobacteria bacterium]|nr:aminotransferase class IV [Deltaproteobacteria bacterium]